MFKLQGWISIFSLILPPRFPCSEGGAPTVLSNRRRHRCKFPERRSDLLKRPTSPPECVRVRERERDGSPLSSGGLWRGRFIESGRSVTGGACLGLFLNTAPLAASSARKHSSGQACTSSGSSAHIGLLTQSHIIIAAVFAQTFIAVYLLHATLRC